MRSDDGAHISSSDAESSFPGTDDLINDEAAPIPPRRRTSAGRNVDILSTRKRRPGTERKGAKEPKPSKAATVSRLEGQASPHDGCAEDLHQGPSPSSPPASLESTMSGKSRSKRDGSSRGRKAAILGGSSAATTLPRLHNEGEPGTGAARLREASIELRVKQMRATVARMRMLVAAWEEGNREEHVVLNDWNNVWDKGSSLSQGTMVGNMTHFKEVLNRAEAILRRYDGGDDAPSGKIGVGGGRGPSSGPPSPSSGGGSWPGEIKPPPARGSQGGSIASDDVTDRGVMLNGFHSVSPTQIISKSSPDAAEAIFSQHKFTPVQGPSVHTNGQGVELDALFHSADSGPHLHDYGFDRDTGSFWPGNAVWAREEY